ncbi:unnamed protein product [Clonostachys rosea]|uniref:Xylanolytic transcriptional activator regulatory domain-containing protein n=1 Tax=Bionectria ochroleuca TaxID=29856 RepID=A0ABY6UBM1_BIOOC|nr:unnamed protein product [Clonostachys rosea]
MPFLHPARLHPDSSGPGRPANVAVMSATQLPKSKSRLGSKLKRNDLGKRRRRRTNLGDRAKDARLHALKRAARRTSNSKVAPLLASRSRLVPSSQHQVLSQFGAIEVNEEVEILLWSFMVCFFAIGSVTNYSYPCRKGSAGIPLVMTDQPEASMGEQSPTAVTHQVNCTTTPQNQNTQPGQPQNEFAPTEWIVPDIYSDPFSVPLFTDDSDSFMMSLEAPQNFWPPLPEFIKHPPDHFRQGHIMFLLAEGALTLPSVSLQYALVEAWAEFAYPYMPLAHIHDLLNTIHNPNNSGQRISLLLYQAILFAGSAFVDTKHLRQENHGFSSRRDARKELARRVTLLYDLEYERDKVTLVQVALLMSSWSDMPHANKDSWHWLGVAISMAYAVGMNNQSTILAQPPREQRLWRRIWWSCYSRDRFLALGLRRPMRINNEDVTVTGLELNDFELNVVPDDNTIIRSRNTPLRDLNQQLQLVDLFIYRSRLCAIVTSVLHVQDAHDKSMSAMMAINSKWSQKLDHDFSQAEAALNNWKNSLPRSCEDRPAEQAELDNGSATIAVQRTHLHMTFQTILYSLHRPRFLPTSPKMLTPANKRPKSNSVHQIRNSAVQITRIAKNLGEMHLDRFLPVSGVTVIFPAMVISLLDMKSRDAGVRQAATERFSTCMRVMETLQETYIAADSTINYFKMALQKASISLSTAMGNPKVEPETKSIIPTATTPNTFVDPTSLAMPSSTPSLDFPIDTSLLDNISKLKSGIDTADKPHILDSNQDVTKNMLEDNQSPANLLLKNEAGRELEYLFSGWRDFPHHWGAGSFDEAIEGILESAGA